MNLHSFLPSFLSSKAKPNFKIRSILRALHDGLHHSTADLDGVSEAGLEEALGHDEALAPGVEVAEADALGPAAGGEGELEVLGAEGVVADADADGGLEARAAAEQVLRHAEPEPEQRRAADHVVVGDDAQGAPAVDHGQQAEVVVGQGLVGADGGGPRVQAELVEDAVVEQGRGAPPARGVAVGAEDLLAGGEDARAQLVLVAPQHQLVELGDGAGVLGDLLARLRVEDREPRVHVPLLVVDAHHQVDLDVLDAADVARALPGELRRRVPRLAHAEEGRVRHRLRVRRDAVVLVRRQVHVLGAEAPQHGLYLGERRVRGAVFDQDLYTTQVINAKSTLAKKDTMVGLRLPEAGPSSQLPGRVESDRRQCLHLLADGPRRP